MACAAAGLGCEPGARDERPSLLLVVLDTTRMDAVSAYGRVDGTTPRFDSLAREGVLYRWALAPSPWTLPSHATLFTSQGPERHGVGVAGRFDLGTGLATLAEELARAGYQTAGFSENPLVGGTLGLDRGFDSFASDAELPEAKRPIDVVRAVDAWLGQRDRDRPFFLFVNLFDPHDPYVLHQDPASADRLLAFDPERVRDLAEADSMRGIALRSGICDRLPPASDVAILRALYLGEVRKADAKLGEIHGLLAEARGPLISVITADHGEHLGEHGLLGHEFSLRGEVLHVPLLVHGLPGVAPAAIEAPVGLEDVAPSLLAWTGLEVPASWAGRPLPLAPGRVGERGLRAAYDDTRLVAPDGAAVQDYRRRRRRGCDAEDRVFGRLLSLVRFPYKLVWYERNPAQLYDLERDLREQRDLADEEPERAAALETELLGWKESLEAVTAPGEAPDPEAVEALRALGYVE